MGPAAKKKRRGDPHQHPDWIERKWSLLAALEVDQKRIAGMYYLGDCLADGCGPECSEPPDYSRTPLPPLNFRHWPACPITLLRHWRWQTIVRTYNASLLSNLEGFPLRFEAWRVDGLEHIRRAKQKHDNKPRPKGSVMPFPGQAVRGF